MNKSKVISTSLLIALFSAPLLWATASPAPTADDQSVYSGLDDASCKVIAQAAPGDGAWTRWRCPGVLGYELERTIDDDRESLQVIFQGKKQDLQFFQN